MIGFVALFTVKRRVFAAFCTVAAISQIHGQKLEISPNRVMVDESATLRATGLQPNERVTIAAELTDGGDVRWTSKAEFIADESGDVDVSKQAPVTGSYKEVSAMGLVWSMTETGRKEARYQPPKNFGEQAIEFRLMRKNEQIAAARLEQVAIAEGVRRLIVRDGDLRGTLFIPSGPQGAARHPGVLVLGGSEGGLPSRRAVWLASHGYAVFALAYFHYEDLPPDLEAIPLEYFGRALSWMALRPEIDPDHIGVMGGSRGGELALQLGSMYPRIKTVVAYVPADKRHAACCGFTPRPYAWTWQGNPLGFVTVRGPNSHPEMLLKAAIEVERIQGPVLLISGQADGVWQSSAMADSVVDRLKRAHFAYEVEHLKYAHAGHTAGRPEIVPSWQGMSQHPLSGRMVNTGGTPKGNAESSLDAIPKVLEFLGRSLRN
jgi:dienelactone hydrolase